MTNDPDRTDERAGWLNQFEKNRYFDGKLMTARDMETEQRYHAERLRTVNQLVAGAGVLSGLEISAVQERDDGLAVTIEPGAALDGWGRPIVVEHTTTATLPLPDGDVVYLFLGFAESTLESVPVPDVAGADEEEYRSNRAVEGFELSYRETAPETEPFPAVDTRADGSTDEATRGRTVGDQYHRRHRQPHETTDEPLVLVGVYERGRNDEWTERDTPAGRDLVYDNEMLFGALLDHVTDTENPHRTAGAGGQPVESDAAEFSEEIRAMRTELDDLSAQLDTLTRFLMRKTLKEKIRFFSDVSDRFENQDAEGSKIAQEIVDQAREGMQASVFDDPDDYRTHIAGMMDQEVDLGEALEESATEASLERYVRAVSELQAAIADEEPVLTVAEAQDRVCEAADSLDLLYDIVRDS